MIDLHEGVWGEFASRASHDYLNEVLKAGCFSTHAIAEYTVDYTPHRCKGCDLMIVGNPANGQRRIWCSQTCALKWKYQNDPHFRAKALLLANATQKKKSAEKKRRDKKLLNASPAGRSVIRLRESRKKAA